MRGMHIHVLTEYDVLAIEPGCDDSGHEELRTVGVCARIGHGEEVWPVMLELEVLVYHKKRQKARHQHPSAGVVGGPPHGQMDLEMKSHNIPANFSP